MHRALEQDQVGRQRVGALPGDLAGPGEVRPAALFQQLDVIQRLEAELRRGPHGPQDHVGGVVRPDRGAFPRDGGGQQQQPVQLLRRLRELLAERLELGLELGVLGPQLGPPGVVGLGELLRRALPARLGLVQFVLELAGSPVEVEQLVDVQVDALDPDGGLHRVRVLPYLSPVQHGYASVLVTISLLVSPPRKRYQQWPPPTPRSFRPARPAAGRRVRWIRGDRGRWGRVLLTNHVLSGALIGALARRPLPAFAAGVASHFVLDAVPHWGDWGSRRRFLRVAVADGLVSLAVAGAFAAASPPERRAAVLAGMAGAALPDLDKPTKLWFGWSPFPAGGRPVSQPHPARGLAPRLCRGAGRGRAGARRADRAPWIARSSALAALRPPRQAAGTAGRPGRPGRRG